jgi:hypothetical protein
MGACQAVIANIAVQPHTLDWSLFWIKDQYNDVIDEACEVGARLGVQIHSAAPLRKGRAWFRRFV